LSEFKSFSRNFAEILRRNARNGDLARPEIDCRGNAQGVQ